MALSVVGRPALAQTPATWKTLVWVSSRATVLSNDGPYRQQRYFIDEPEMDRLRETLDIAEKIAETESGGKLDVQFEVRVDPVPFYRESLTAPDPLFTSISTRFNEALFESDDKTPRGPYSSVMVIDPQPGAWETGSPLRQKHPAMLARFSTPIAFLSLLPTNGGEGATALAQDFIGTWRAQVAMRSGWTTRWTPESQNWDQVPVPGAVVRPNLSITSPLTAFAPLSPSTPGIFSTPERVDSENGPGFKILVKPGVREGEVLLLDGLQVDLNATPILEFWIQSRVTDPLELRFGAGGPRLTLGYSPELAAANPRWVLPAKESVWTKVRVDCSGWSAAPISQISLAVPNLSRRAESVQLGIREVTIAGLRFVPKDAQPVDATNVVPEDWAQVFAAATSPTLQALNSNSRNVMLAALGQLLRAETKPDDGLRARLAELARNSEPMISITALRVLTRYEPKDYLEPIRYALQVGPFEHCRLGAAQIIAESNDPARIPALATMLTAREWRSRLAAVQGLSKVATRETAIILLAMLPDPEPMVRKAICEGVDMKMDLANRRLLFAAVNDPVEEVRIAAYRRLLNEGLEEFRAEAMKGVREESPYVRTEVLTTMAKKPDAAYRRYVLLGLGDRDPRVRLSAVDALAKQPGDLKREELEAVLVDPDEFVRAAAVALATARGV